jgi:hypothetical protein
MEWLNHYSAAITALATVVLTFITAYYAYINFGLLRENRELRSGMQRPELAVYVTAHEGWANFVNLVVENVGPGAAYDVRLSTDREFTVGRDVDFGSLGLFRHTLGFLATRQRIEHLLAVMVTELFKEQLEISAIYSDSQGEIYKKKFAINFAVFENIARPAKHPLYSLAGSLEKIQENLEKLATGSRKMQVLTEPLEQYTDRERAELIYFLIRQLPEAEQRELTDSLQAKVRDNRSRLDAEEAHNPGPQADG